MTTRGVKLWGVIPRRGVGTTQVLSSVKAGYLRRHTHGEGDTGAGVGTGAGGRLGGVGVGTGDGVGEAPVMVATQCCAPVPSSPGVRTTRVLAHASEAVR